MSAVFSFQPSFSPPLGAFAKLRFFLAAFAPCAFDDNGQCQCFGRSARPQTGGCLAEQAFVSFVSIADAGQDGTAQIRQHNFDMIDNEENMRALDLAIQYLTVNEVTKSDPKIDEAKQLLLPGRKLRRFERKAKLIFYCEALAELEIYGFVG